MSLKGANSMAMSGIGIKMSLVGTGKAISRFKHMWTWKPFSHLV